LIMSGSLWIKPPNAFRPQFLDINKKFFGFTLSPTQESSGPGADAINSWAARQAGVRLDHLIDPANSDDFSLADTTWFKGSWVQPFVVSDTHTGDFTLLSGTKKSVPMMPKSGKQFYLRGTNFQAVGLGYWNATLYVFLPDEDSSLQEFERSLTPDHWNTWMAEFGSREGYLELPRFRSEYHGDTKAVLQALGMNYPFESFSSFAPAVTNSAGAKLSRAVSIVLLSVDEKGTEVISIGSLAGVVGGIGPAEPPPPPPFRMVVNRPFFFAICDRRNGAVLYMGAIVEP
jgi:serine protease inhibitor